MRPPDRIWIARHAPAFSLKVDQNLAERFLLWFPCRPDFVVGGLNTRKPKFPDEPDSIGERFAIDLKLNAIGIT